MDKPSNEIEVMKTWGMFPNVVKYIEQLELLIEHRAGKHSSLDRVQVPNCPGCLSSKVKDNG